MIHVVSDNSSLNDFIFFVRDLYKNDSNFACPVFFSLKKELRKELFIKKRSIAVLCVRDSVVVGRLLFGISKSKQKSSDIGYFSFFDSVDDFSVAQELFAYMENYFKGKVSYVEGTFSPLSLTGMLNIMSSNLWPLPS